MFLDIFSYYICFWKAVGSLLIIIKHPLIRDVQRWMAREAGPAGQSSRAGGAGQLSKQGRAVVEQHSLTAREP